MEVDGMDSLLGMYPCLLTLADLVKTAGPRAALRLCFGPAGRLALS